jgi:hypothetical protein
MTRAELTAQQAAISAELADRDSNTQKMKEWAGRSLGRLEAAREVFAQSAPAPAPTNGQHKQPVAKPAIKAKAKSKGKRTTKQVETRPTYRDPKSGREWRGYGPMPKWLASIPEVDRKAHLLSTSQG